MKWIVVGLGNPGEEYVHTRHNAGRRAVEAFAEHTGCTPFTVDKKIARETAKGSSGAHTVLAILPNTFMNKSGTAVKDVVTTIKAAERLIVVYDDIDLPFGALKVSFGRGSGGHKGVESIIRTVKTKNFVRVRIGVAPTTLGGKIKKPLGEQKVHDHLLGVFSKREEETLHALFTRASAAIESIIVDGRAQAMNTFNQTA